MGIKQRRGSAKPSGSDKLEADRPKSPETVMRTMAVMVIGLLVLCCSCIAYSCQAATTKLSNHIHSESHPREQVPSSETSERKAYLKGMFFPLEGIKSPPLGDDGFYPIDELTERLIAVVRTEAPAEADRIRDAIKQSPVEPGPRMQLCRTLEQVKQPNKSRSDRFTDFVQCYRRYMDLFAYADFLDPNDSRRQVSRMEDRCFGGLAAGERLLAYCQDKTDRISDAIRFLHEGLGKGWRGAGRWCKPWQSCYDGYGLLLLALRLQEAPSSKIETIFQEALKVPGPTINWVNAMSVHRQTHGIRDRAFWDPLELSWLPDVDIKTHGLRIELDAYIKRVEAVTGSFVWPNQPKEAYLSGDGQWNAVEISLDGQWGTACNAFPSTCASLRDRQELNRSNFRSELKSESPPSTTVSMYQLVAGATIRAHFGRPSRIVAALALRASPGGTIRVGAERRTWTEGHWVVFDDSYERDVINNSSEPLYILQVAMLHPDVMY